ncbi:MAG: hypothetical protein JNM36_11315 [Chitinophagales bacterium]|nr:hypothetical protein [Chitinophagales bacterium]
MSFPFDQIVPSIINHYQLRIPPQELPIIYFTPAFVDIQTQQQLIEVLWKPDELAELLPAPMGVLTVADVVHFKSKKRLTNDFWTQNLSIQPVPAPIAAFLQLIEAAWLQQLLIHLPTIWLSTDWGKQIQLYLLDHFVVRLVLTFPYTETHCLLIERQTNEVLRNQHKAVFVEWQQKDSHSLDSPVTIKRLLEARHNEATEICKITTVSQFMLRANAYHWSDYCHAPNVYWDILQRTKNKLSTLQHFCTLQIGIETPCDDFFIVENMMPQVAVDIKTVISDSYILANIQNNIGNFQYYIDILNSDLCIVRNTWGSWWLIETDYLIPFYKPEQTNEWYILRIGARKQHLGIYLKAYLAAGEHKKIPQRVMDYRAALLTPIAPNVAWYHTPLPAPAPLILALNNENKLLLHTQTALTTAKALLCYPNNKNRHLPALFLSSWFNLLVQMNAADSLRAEVVQRFWVPTHEMPPQELPFWSETWTKDIGFDTNGAWAMEQVRPERLSLDEKMLSVMGVVNPKERRQLLTALYLALYQYQQTHTAIDKANLPSNKNKTIKTQQFISLTQQITNQKLPISKTIEFAYQLRALVQQITPDTRQQKRLFSDFWKQQFGERFDFKAFNHHDNALF